MAIPGRDIGVADWPVDAVAIAEIGFEIELAPSPAGATPEETAAAKVVAANPAEILLALADVRMLAVIDEEVLRRLAERVVLALNRVISLVQFLVTATAMREVPRLQPLGDVVLAVFHVSAALDNESAEPVLRQLLGGPAARHAGADDDGVKWLVMRWRHVDKCLSRRPGATNVRERHTTLEPAGYLEIAKLLRGSG